MKPTFGRIAVALGVLGCGCGGKVSASSVPDASDTTCNGVSPSAAAAYWSLEKVPATLSIPCDEPSEYATVVARAELDEDCLEPGPIYAARVETRYDVYVYAWRHHVACASISPRAFLRPLRLELALGARAQVVDAPSELVLPVAQRPGVCAHSGSYGEPCTADCDCLLGGQCVPEAAGACAGTCNEPCAEDLDCATGKCTLVSGAAIPTCRTGNCGPGGDLVCPSGMTCLCSSPPPSCQCTWRGVEPPAHQACSDDSDCPAPTECVEGGPCGRECGIRCSTTQMRCPEGSWCPATPRADRPWTCEVIQ